MKDETPALKIDEVVGGKHAVVLRRHPWQRVFHYRLAPVFDIIRGMRIHLLLALAALTAACSIGRCQASGSGASMAKLIS